MRVEVSGAWIAPTIVAALAALLVAFLGGTLTDLGPWYSGLSQPVWAPPREAFPIIWTTVLALTALAAISAWRAAPAGRASEWLVGLFALNGFLNILWSLLFFRVQRPDWALLELALLWLSIVALVVACMRHSRIGGLLLLPYLLWVTVAGALNYAIVQLNGPFG